MLVLFASARAEQASAAPAPADSSLPGLVSPDTAALWSIAGTTVPILVGAEIANLDEGSDTPVISTVLVLAGVLAGPACGHFYARRPLRASAGIALRTLALGTAVVAIGSSFENDSDGSATIAVVGLGTCVFSFLIDLFEAPASARKHNQEIERAHMGVTPTIGRDGTGGIRLTVGF